MNHKIKVIINGAQGKMGQASVVAVENDSQLQLVAALGRNDNLLNAIKEMSADVVIDFTTPQAVYTNTKTIIEANAHPVIGSTGLTPEQIQELQRLSSEKKWGGVIAPNFSIGALLMMRLSAEAARYLNDVEIIEMHHDGKKDAPSGTAIKTAEMISENITKKNIEENTEKNKCIETLPGARGATKNDIPIHSIRLPGFVAHQQIIFGGSGETLTIRHDSINRECFMPGVVMACKKVMALDQLVYGLDQLVFEN